MEFKEFKFKINTEYGLQLVQVVVGPYCINISCGGFSYQFLNDDISKYSIEVMESGGWKSIKDNISDYRYQIYSTLMSVVRGSAIANSHYRIGILINLLAVKG